MHSNYQQIVALSDPTFSTSQSAHLEIVEILLGTSTALIGFGNKRPVCDLNLSDWVRPTLILENWKWYLHHSFWTTSYSNHYGDIFTALKGISVLQNYPYQEVEESFYYQY